LHLSNPLLSIHQYQVLEAVGGVDTMRQISEDPGIKMVITDYNMPNIFQSDCTCYDREDNKPGGFANLFVTEFGHSTNELRPTA